METSKTLAADRIEYLDAAKGIFIIFIVMVHHLLGADSLVRYLYSMGVTPFFLISGFLYAYKKEWEQPFDRIFIKHIKKFMYPFLTFSIINLTWNVLYYQVVFPSAEPPYSMKKMFLYTVSTYGYNALWYLPCVFWGTLLFFAIRRRRYHGPVLAAFALGLMVFYILFDKRLEGLGFISYLYCYLLRIAVAVVFLYGGSLLYRVFRALDRTREKLLLYGCLAVSAVIAALYWLYPEAFPVANLAVHRLGNPYVYYLASVSNTTVILLLCKKFLFRSRLLTFFGRNSLILMALHMDVTIRIAWVIFPQLPMDFGDRINSLIIIAMELVMFLVIIPILNRFFPFVVKFPVKTEKGGR